MRIQESRHPVDGRKASALCRDYFYSKSAFVFWTERISSGIDPRLVSARNDFQRAVCKSLHTAHLFTSDKTLISKLHSFQSPTAEFTLLILPPVLPILITLLFASQSSLATILQMLKSN